MTIRWPWVSRATLDAAERDVLLYKKASDIDRTTSAKALETLHDLSARFDAALNAECGRYEALLARYHMLRLQGFSEPAAPVVRPTIAPDPIKRAIAQRAGTNRQLRENMERQVAQDRLLGKTDEEILSAIIAGVSGEDLILSEAGLMST